MDDQDRIRRAQRAESIMTDPIMVEAAEHIEAECWRLFRTLPPTDAEGMGQIKAIQYMHDKYKAVLKAALADGKMATMELAAKQPEKRGLMSNLRERMNRVKMD